MNLFRGSWNTTDEEVPVHSPVRLLQKLSAYRASAASPSASSSPSPSPQHDRKSTILSESTNFFARLWRPNTHHAAASPLLIASHETKSSSFDHIPEPSPAHMEASSGLSVAPKLNRRISLIREVSSKSPPHLVPFPGAPLPPPPFKTQPTASSTVTDPSFEDTTSDHPGDTTSEFHPDRLDEADDKMPDLMAYDERPRRISLASKSVILQAQAVLPSSMRVTDQYHSDSLASPEANIDVSMVSDNE
jgi:hypothetical protein